MSITDVIAAPGFAYAGTITVTRTSAGTTDGHGRYVPGATSSFVLSPVGVIPGSSHLKPSAEGWSAEASVLLYTTTKLIKLPVPDKVTITPAGGVAEDFAVVAVEGPWVGLDCTMYVVTLARLSTPGDS